MAESKRLLVRPNGSGLYKVIYEGGGELPKVLSGLYTSKRQANKDIDIYLTSKNRTNGSDSAK